MKRRLDLALALVHGPRVLFLDEPTTGLDIQSRTALWDEVARLARDDGVTVFLTTQYLEEADALADRVGIIDHGRIVAEGTPAALKAEIGRPTVEAAPPTPATETALERRAGAVRRAGARPRAASPCASREGSEELADVVRGARRRGRATSPNLEIHAPTPRRRLPEAKTGRSLEGAGDEAAEERGHRRARAPAAWRRR